MNTYSPMLARASEKPFDSPDWLFEVKWDGVRAIAYVGDTLSVKSRNGKELTGNFPELAELKELAGSVVLDGEIIVMNEGDVDFQLAAKRTLVSDPSMVERLRRQHPATYIVFDILEKDGESLIDQPLSERLTALDEALRDGAHVVKSKPVENTGVAFYTATVKQGLEGIIAKRKSSTYSPGARSGDWLKFKHVKTCDCVVFGYTPGEGARQGSFGALLLGLYDGTEPVYVGRVGTGFTDDQLEALKRRLDTIKTMDPWFTASDIPENSTWVKPQLVAAVGFHEATRDNRLRAPRFQGLRDDKPPAFCTVSQLHPVTLDEYWAKRDFARTSEPLGGASPGQGNGFVVQEHHARRTHWDFRLERGDVLVSWAVPRGVPSEPGDRRLAVQTEPHPIEYGGFEGTIPRGEYGAGAVTIWDRGFYVPVVWTEEKVEVILVGERINGRYELVHTGDDNWLMFLKENRGRESD